MHLPNPPHPRVTPLGGWLAALLLPVLGAAPAMASATSGPVSLLELIAGSSRILGGTVMGVEPGVSAAGVPYTEVTIQVSETLRGPVDSGYRFREPRAQRGSRTTPVWARGERVILFLAPPQTGGFQRTVGGRSGKLRRLEGRLTVGRDNPELFADLEVNASGLSLEQMAMVAGVAAEVDDAAFLDLVRRAVDEEWVERGLLRHRAPTSSAASPQGKEIPAGEEAPRP